MATLDIFRSTVAAAALGLARRAFDEMIERAATRKMFGAPLADLQLTQAALADSAIDIDAAALLVYRAAWEKDRGATRITRRGIDGQGVCDRDGATSDRPRSAALRR